MAALSFTATPAQHFSGRGLFDRNRKTLWSSFVLSTHNRRLFFSADTGLTDELQEIGRRFGPFEVSMIEIGAWHPAWGSIHLGPANAMRAFDMVGGGTFLPIHWATFDLALHAWDEPIETLMSLAQSDWCARDHASARASRRARTPRRSDSVVAPEPLDHRILTPLLYHCSAQRRMLSETSNALR